jgi:hypothetical protein
VLHLRDEFECCIALSPHADVHLKIHPKGSGVSGRRIRPITAKRMPIRNRKTKGLFHALASNNAILIVVTEREKLSDSAPSNLV